MEEQSRSGLSWGFRLRCVESVCSRIPASTHESEDQRVGD